MVRNVVAPLVLRPSRRRGLGTFRVSYYPLKSVSAGNKPFKVSEEGESWTGGVAAEDISFLEFSNQTLGVRGYSPLELEVVEKL